MDLYNQQIAKTARQPQPSGIRRQEAPEGISVMCFSMQKLVEVTARVFDYGAVCVDRPDSTGVWKTSSIQQRVPLLEVSLSFLFCLRVNANSF